MANPASLEPLQYGCLPENDLSNPNLSIDFDSLQFPPIDTEFLTNDLTLPEGLMADLGFDDDFDFSFDDLYLPPENEGLGLVGEGSDVLSSTVTVSGGDQNSDDSGKVLNSLSPDSGSCDREFAGPVSSQDSGGCGSGVSGFLNSPSPDSCGISASSSVPVSSNPVVDVADQKIKLEEEGKECLSKRKKETEDENSNPNPRNSKVRKSISSENTNSVVVDEEDKKKARLMRNRESAQLSRQRKKHYVEELEDKVRSMHSTIAELNSKISFVMAENASLRQQLSGGAVCPPPPGMYPPPPMGHMPYPWIPCPPYPMRSQGSQVPLVPIPRLKPQQPASSTKAKKSENKKKESKTKKVASVSFLGLLFFMFLFGVLVPSVRENGEMGYSGLGLNNGGSTGLPRGRVLSVNGSDHNVGVGLCSGKSGFREHDSKGLNCKRVGVGRDGSKVKQDERGTRNGFKPPENASEPLVASLYVPRNDKLVKIDGNLIIHSVMASEKAMASRGKINKGTVSSASKGGETGLAIPGDLAPVLVGGRNVERHRNVYRSAAERQKALTSGSRDSYKDNLRSPAADGSLQKWFREGLAGPILSSGMCTEVFQFDVSSPSAIIPATSIANVSVVNGTDTANLKKNRRILNHLPIPIVGTPVNGTEEQAEGPTQNANFQGNNSVSSMVVSVLVDPREGGDNEGVDGMIRPKSLSRIFVVVLLDSVKYVTYSCVLPLKGSGPHLVTT
ncbi:Basic-leucine zipper domain [Macleaya cordata]|uniref:Basic-leucine zipper domain n=1 Tax=Macleaya cordata TaxID=56857 RepID=A0A200RD88_MACCD|nr:Basic-leucine zipper domain [Macleaya cordata]